LAATRCSYNLRGDSVGPSQTFARRTNNGAITFVNVEQSNFTVALRAFGDETVNQPLFFPLIAVLAVSDGLAPSHVRIVRFRTLRCLAKYKGQPGVPEAPPNWPCAQNVCNNSRLERSPNTKPLWPSLLWNSIATTAPINFFHYSLRPPYSIGNRIDGGRHSGSAIELRELSGRQD